MKHIDLAFNFHVGWFEECWKQNYDLGNCFYNTSFLKGMHRNKVVNELSGFYAPTERGGVRGRVNGIIPHEAT